MSIFIMVNGIPGKMGVAVAESVLRKGFQLIPYSLCSEGQRLSEFEIAGQQIQLLKPSARDAQIAQIQAQYPNFISIDYTHPTAVNENAEFYAKHHLPFVMGTTGGDRDKLYRDVHNAQLNAVIAPNMGKQIVAFQAMMEWAAQEFPGVFDGYELFVEETHQHTKADTSGTAKAVVNSFNQMGLPYTEEQIRLCRNPIEAQSHFKVPKEHVMGHAYHTYTVTSYDGSVQFEFKHNVCGRRFYADGTVDAAEFLHHQILKNKTYQIFSMIDVLKSGKMK